MIGHIRGSVLAWQPPQLLLDVGGVGLEVRVATADLQEPSIGSEQALFTHAVIRENDWSLYGFSSEKHRDMFRAMIQVNKIGPSLALSVMSHMPFAQLCVSLMEGDEAALLGVPGIGRRVAQRLVMEMRDKAPLFADLGEKDRSNHQAVQDACQALEALGYSNQEAQKAVTKINTGKEDSETLLREVLREGAVR